MGESLYHKSPLNSLGGLLPSTGNLSTEQSLKSIHPSCLDVNLVRTWEYPSVGNFVNVGIIAHHELKVGDDVPCWRRLMLQHLTWTWTSSVNTCIHLLEAASLPGKSLSFEDIWTNHRGRRFVRPFPDSCFCPSKLVININRSDLENWKARISRVLRSTRCREVAENHFPPRNKRSSRETTKKWTSCHLAPGGSHLKVTRIREWIKTFPPKRSGSSVLLKKNGCFHDFHPGRHHLEMRIPNFPHLGRRRCWVHDDVYRISMKWFVWWLQKSLQ